MTLRDEWLTLSDDDLLRQCEVDTYRASGPGGQKRNKTSSAVRLRHAQSGQLVIAEESRSQHENKARAIKRLRMAIALNCRADFALADGPPAVFKSHQRENGALEISTRNADFPLCIALALDALTTAKGGMKDAAALLGMSTSGLSDLLTCDPKVMEQSNRIRVDHGLKRLTA